MIAYSSGDYKKAIEGFDKLLAKGENPEVRFYKGLALLGTGGSKEALNILNSLSSDKEFKFHEALPWYKSLALLKENKVTLAKLELNKIIDSGQSFRQQSAKKLLKSLK